MISKYWNLMTLKAFRRGKSDSMVPIIDRFVGESLLGLFCTGRSVEVFRIVISKDQTVDYSPIDEFSINEEEGNSLNSVFSEISAKGYGQHVAISVLSSPEIFPISKDYTLAHDETVQEAMFKNPSRVIGGVYDESRRYLAIGDRLNPFQYALSYPKGHLDTLFHAASSVGWTPVRMSCPFYAILYEASLKDFEQAMVVYLKGHLLLAHKERKGWGTISISHDIEEEQLEGVLEEFLTQLPKTGGKLWVVSDSEWDIEAYMGLSNNWDACEQKKHTNCSMAPFQAMIKNG